MRPLLLMSHVVCKDGVALRIELSKADFVRRRGNVTRFWRVRALEASRELTFVSFPMSGEFSAGEVLSYCK